MSSILPAPFPPEQLIECYGLELSAGGTLGTITANDVFLYLFRIFAPTQLLSMRTHVGVGGTGNVDMGVYSLDGSTLLDHTGPLPTVSGTNVKGNLLAQITLWVPGFYWLAMGIDNGVDTLSKASNLGVPGKVSSIRAATNGLVASNLPSSTGVILAPNSSGMPIWQALTTGGLT
jgi:hypothetical protein